MATVAQAADNAPSIKELKLKGEDKPKEEAMLNGVCHPEEPIVEEYEGEQDGEGDDGEDSDGYDVEEEQQAPEGEDDEYGDVEGSGNDKNYSQQKGHKGSLTALLLGDPTVEEVEQDDDYEDTGDDEDEEDEDDDDYVSEPDSPTTAKKRTIDEVLEETASPRGENEAKKVKA
ncbi:hypothetical protein CC2G_000322 [Coprinopsis cinerea AmutBmut pab1-1]|nr:hypothetical protein CC2G_000322 [Coprinopsis cinerea AmutBmut pab1-1]